MKKLYDIHMILLILILTAFLPCSLKAEEETLVSDDRQITINNRLLAHVNGKNITVMDVMKKMEVFLARNYPDHANNPLSKFQFYSGNWRAMLKQMIDQELMVADAQKIDLKINDSEIRETLHERFGPNMMPTLDKLGVTLDEARHMIYMEMAVQRMSWLRVHSKAAHRIGPHQVKNAYVQYVKDHPPSDRWKYRVLSIRSLSEELGRTIAQKAYALLSQKKNSIEDIASALKSDGDEKTSIQLSEEYNLTDKELSESHKQVLKSLKVGSISQPIIQVSRDQSKVQRIFYLKEHLIENPPPFRQINEKLQDELVEKEIDKEMPLYLSRLRKQFNFDEGYLEAIPKDFQPFILQ